MATLPTLSVIVPCFNASATLARTLDSLCSQQAGGVELLVIDGGSTDATAQVLARFAAHLTRCVSEPDRGQSHAINKGFALSTGRVVAWLNADDVYEPGAIAVAREVLDEAAHADRPVVLAGACRMVHEDVAGTDYTWTPRSKDLEVMHCRAPFAQPAAFMTRAAARAAAERFSLPPGQLVREELHFAMDQDLWCRARAAGAGFTLSHRVLATFSVGAAAKSTVGGRKIAAEMERVYREHAPASQRSLPVWYRRTRLPAQLAARGLPAPLRKLWTRTGDAVLVAALAARFGRRNVKAMDWTWCL